MIWAELGSLFMLTAVAAGAFGAHALKHQLSPDRLAVFETAVRYQAYHALALLFVAWLAETHPRALVTAAGGSFTAGILVFSGSLYALSLSGARGWGVATPVGGLAFLAGWAFLFFSVL